MCDRSANETIKGYFYQFDYSILKLLELNELEDEIVIECIEDVDISSENNYIAIQCKYYEGTEYNHSVIAPNRFFLLEINPVNYNRVVLKDIIYTIINKWSSSSKRTIPYCPYIYLHNLAPDEWISIKKVLYDEKTSFVDGYPYLGSEFHCEAICQNSDHNNNKINVRLLSDMSCTKATINYLKTTREIYQFYLNNIYFEFDDPNVKHVKIQVLDIKDLKEFI